MKKLALVSLPSLFIGMPFLALAATQGVGGLNLTYLQGYSNSITGLINGIIVPVLIAIAFLVFLWGIYKAFIWNAASESDKMEGRKFAMWGIIGFVIIFAVWGLVGLLGTTLGLSPGGSSPPFPTIGGSSAPASGGGTRTEVFPSAGGVTTPGYGSGTGSCTPPEVQSPEGGCYTPVTNSPTPSSGQPTDLCTNDKRIYCSSINLTCIPSTGECQ